MAAAGRPGQDDEAPGTGAATATRGVDNNKDAEAEEAEDGEEEAQDEQEDGEDEGDARNRQCGDEEGPEHEEVQEVREQ